MRKKMNLVFRLMFCFAAAGFAVLSFDSQVLAQTSEEKAVTDVLRQSATAFARSDMATLETVWANSADLTVFENGEANYGWTDYRDNHLAPEIKEFKNTKYELSDIKTKIDGKITWSTFKYTISGDIEKRHVDGAGLGTAVLEKMKGSWKIVHWHSSATRKKPAPQKSPAPK